MKSNKHATTTLITKLTLSVTLATLAAGCGGTTNSEDGQAAGAASEAPGTPRQVIVTTNRVEVLTALGFPTGVVIVDARDTLPAQELNRFARIFTMPANRGKDADPESRFQLSAADPCVGSDSRCFRATGIHGPSPSTAILLRGVFGRVELVKPETRELKGVPLPEFPVIRFAPARADDIDVRQAIDGGEGAPSLATYFTDTDGSPAYFMARKSGTKLLLTRWPTNGTKEFAICGDDPFANPVEAAKEHKVVDAQCVRLTQCATSPPHDDACMPK